MDILNVLGIIWLKVYKMVELIIECCEKFTVKLTVGGLFLLIAGGVIVLRGF